jgi:biotin synthase
MSLEFIIQERDVVLRGDKITFEAAERLLGVTEVHIPYLTAAANEIRVHFNGNKVETCALSNAKSGACSEDCKFCAQSAHFKTDSPVYGLITAEEMVRQAKEAEAHGATEFCIVTSGWGQTVEKEFDTIVEAVRRISKETKIQIDCSLGFLKPEQMKRLSDAGLYRNNHNLEACQSFFSEVVKSHTYMDRVNHVELVKEFGIHPCSGGILGMGETPRQRLELAFALRKLDAECVPINILNPRAGTPFEHLEPLKPMEILTTIAVFRFILPQSTIKIAGGREINLRDLQAQALLAGANGLILGNYLTTMGRRSDQDIQMLKDLGYEVNTQPNSVSTSCSTPVTSTT